MHGVVVAGPGGAGDCEEKVVVYTDCDGIVVESLAHGGEEEDHVVRLDSIGGIFPVDVQAVETEVRE